MSSTTALSSVTISWGWCGSARGQVRWGQDGSAVGRGGGDPVDGSGEGR